MCTRILAALAIAALVGSSTGAMPFGVVAKVDLLSFAWGQAIPRYEFEPSLTEVRFLDLGFGARLSSRYLVAARVTVAEWFSRYYDPYPEPPWLSLGLTFMRSAKLGPSTPALAFTAAARGSSEWGILSSDFRFVEVSVGANATFWAVNPELELGLRREWYSDLAHEHQDCVYGVVRLGLGGWYELGKPSSGQPGLLGR